MDDFDTRVKFALEKGRRDTDRLVSHILLAIADKLQGQQIEISGRQCAIKRVGTGDVENQILVDVVNPTDEYDHIEFTITKTGWGRNL